MTKEQQLQFLNNINRLGFEDAVALIDIESVTEDTKNKIKLYATSRESVIELISQEVIDSLEVETLM